VSNHSDIINPEANSKKIVETTSKCYKFTLEYLSQYEERCILCKHKLHGVNQEAWGEFFEDK
jgi:hypothetical protein